MDVSIQDINIPLDSDLIRIGEDLEVDKLKSVIGKISTLDELSMFDNSTSQFKNMLISSLPSLPKGIVINSANMKELLIEYIKSVPSLIWFPIPICILNLTITPDYLLPSHILLQRSRSNSSSTIGTDDEKDFVPDKDIAVSLDKRRFSKKRSRTDAELFDDKEEDVLPKLLVVLDMDETLIHMHTNPKVHYDYTINLLEHSKTDRPILTSCIIHPTMHISLRPGVRQFLDYLRDNSEYFEVALFTAGTQSYADAVLEGLDPSSSIIPSCNRYYRGSCDLATISSNGLVLEEDEQSVSFLQKDLSKLDWPLSRTILVDNSLLSFSAYPDNGVWIKSYRPGGTDYEDDEASGCLPKFTQVVDLLEKLKTVEDVRPYLRNQFNLACLLGKNFDIN